MLGLLHGIVPSKFLKDFAWNIFYSQVFNKYIVVNRVLVDPYLQLFHKAIARNQPMESDEIDYYSLFHGADDNLNINKFKDTENGLLMRQKETLNKINQMQKDTN